MIEKPDQPNRIWPAGHPYLLKHLGTKYSQAKKTGGLTLCMRQFMQKSLPDFWRHCLRDICAIYCIAYHLAFPVSLCVLLCFSRLPAWVIFRFIGVSSFKSDEFQNEFVRALLKARHYTYVGAEYMCLGLTCFVLVSHSIAHLFHVFVDFQGLPKTFGPRSSF